MIDLESQIKSIASNLYNGKFWEGKDYPESTLYLYLRAIAIAIIQYRGYYEQEIQELIIPRVEKYIADYEKLLGIPDDIFTEVEVDLDKRIAVVLAKLLGMLSVTKNEIKNLLQILYPTITNIDIIPSANYGAFNSLYFPRDFVRNGSSNNITSYVITGDFNINIVTALLKALSIFTYDVQVIQM
jgi:hypothetical protein